MGGYYLSAEMQSVYSTVPANWTGKILISYAFSWDIIAMSKKSDRFYLYMSHLKCYNLGPISFFLLLWICNSIL